MSKEKETGEMNENQSKGEINDPQFRDTTKKFPEGKVVTKLQGKAPEQFNPVPVSISGTITAPSRFLDRRKGEYDVLKAHCLASKNEGKLSVIINEQSVTDKYTVTGQIELGKLYKELGINTEKSYNPMNLAKTLKFMRSIFGTFSEHTKLIGQLRTLEARVESQIEDKKDDGGNKTKLFRQTVESNMPDGFNISLPLIEGEEPVSINVAVILEARGGDIICYLESLEAEDIINEQREKIITEEVAKIEKDIVVIYY